MDLTDKTRLSEDIARILANRDWRLVGPEMNQAAWDAFIEQVVAFLPDDANLATITEIELDRAIIGAYCLKLHQACLDTDAARRDRAYSEIWRWVFPRVFSKIHSSQDALEVAQEVLIGIFQGIKRVDRPRGFLAWVNRITYYKLMDYYRRRRDNVDESELIEELDSDETDDLDAIISFEAMEIEIQEAMRDLIERLAQCMSKRAKKQWEVFILLVFGQYSTLEVADMLKTTVNNVYVLFHRARENVLRNCSDLIDSLLEMVRPSFRKKYQARET